MILLFILLFLASSFLMFFASSRMIDSVMLFERLLGWREFVASFFIMSIATTIPNFFVDINAAFKGVPQLAFGDIVGGNIFDLTLAIGLSVVIGQTFIPAKSRLIQTSAQFTVGIAVLPLFLIFDGALSRVDGCILITAFFVYVTWMFFKDDRFSKDYSKGKKKIKGKKKKNKVKVKTGELVKTISWMGVYAFLLFVASTGIIMSAENFSSLLGIGLPVIGMIVVGIANCAPETYSCIVAAKKKQTWAILGNLMGSVIMCATLVLGLVAIVHPIANIDFSPFAVARVFLVLAALFFLVILKTDQKITRDEGYLLIGIYTLFLICEVALYH